jgi:hypothetical protein
LGLMSGEAQAASACQERHLGGRPQHVGRGRSDPQHVRRGSVCLLTNVRRPKLPLIHVMHVGARPLVRYTSAYVSTRQRTSAYVSIRQHTSAYVSIRQHTAACSLYVSIQQRTSAYISIRQHTAAYVCCRIRMLAHSESRRRALRSDSISMRQRTYACVSVRMLTYADVC